MLIQDEYKVPPSTILLHTMTSFCGIDRPDQIYSVAIDSVSVGKMHSLSNSVLFKVGVTSISLASPPGKRRLSEFENRHYQIFPERKKMWTPQKFSFLPSYFGSIISTTHNQYAWGTFKYTGVYE
jgi:hypothetical protein